MLEPGEKEKLLDCQLLIESACHILSGFAAGVIPDIDSIQKCFQEADQTIARLLSA